MFKRKPLYLMAEAEGTGEGSEGAGESAGGAGAEGKPAEQQQAEKTFSQSDVDRIIAGRLSKYSDYDEIKQKLSELAPMREQFDAVTKALGLKEDEKPDPAKLAEQVTAEQGKTADAETRATNAERQLAVYRAAGKNEADPDALLDSATFLGDLKDVDPTDAEAISAAIKKAVDENPRFKATPTAAPSFGGGPRKQADKPDPGPGLPRMRDAYAANTK